MTTPEQFAQQFMQPQAQQYAPPAPAQQYVPPMPQAPQGYAPQQYGAPQQFQQPYAPQFQPQPPQQPLAQGSLDDYFSQPSTGGGPALKFQVGQTHIGVVSRPITHADIQQQTQPGTNMPAFFKDGRPKFVMKVPLTVQPTAENPQGTAQLYVGGGMRDELVRAMAEAGAPEGAPEAGAVIQVTCTGTRPSGPGMNPAKTYQIVYRRPGDANAPAPTPAPPAQQAPVQQAPAPQAQQVAPQPPAAPVQQAPAGPPAATPQTPPVAPSAVPPVDVPPTQGLDPAQMALLQQLTQGQQPQPAQQ